MAGRKGERVKIVATVGPASASVRTLARLIREGADGIRINASHVEPDAVAPLVRRVRRAAVKAGREVAVMLDLPGPKRRLGVLPEPVTLVTGQKIVLSGRKGAGRLPATLGSIVRHLKRGSRIFLKDGHIRLDVASVRGRDVHCVVGIGGRVTSRAGLNVPGVAGRGAVPTARDKVLIEAAIAAKVDLLALSFVQSAKDVARCRALAPDLPVYSKIERPGAIDDLEDVARVSHGLLIARGDLAVEMPPEELPVLQKRIVQTANRHRRPVIVATEMLASMVESPRPTRAELLDVGNAVLDGVDGVMLTSETAIGKHPVQAVRVMARIVATVEKSRFQSYDLSLPGTRGEEADRPDWAVADAAVAAAFSIGARAILAFTDSGRTARLVAAHRPSVPCFAFVARATARRRTALFWGVIPQKSRRLRNSNLLLREAIAQLRRQKRLSKGDRVVAVYGSPLWKPGTRTNTVRVATV
ncbi:MAG: pyruvate kinase [Planctomycetota bacterium]